MSDEPPYTLEIPTRWIDTDSYGHVNNVHYYSFFDTLITTWLVDHGGVDTATDDAIGLCVESQCRFRSSLGFPEVVLAALRVSHIGYSSVRYEITLHGNVSRAPAAEGHFVHVFVDRRRRVPVPIPARLRERLERLLTSVSTVRSKNSAPEEDAASSTTTGSK
jgi:acyl-CoA thioester hydrolase